MRARNVVPLALTALTLAAAADAQTVPRGAVIEAELLEELGPDESRVGDHFLAVADEPVYDEDGRIAIPEEARITGVVTGLAHPEADSPGAVRVDIRTVRVGGESYEIDGTVVEVDVSASDRLTELDETGEGALIGGLLGAALGGILTGDAAETLIGGALGAGAGSVISLGSGAGAALPEGSDLMVRLNEPLYIR